MFMIYAKVYDNKIVIENLGEKIYNIDNIIMILPEVVKYKIIR